MIKNIFYSILLFLLCVPKFIVGHCYKIIQLKDASGNFCYLFADYHQSNNLANKVNITQKDELLSYAKHLNAAVITEDSYLYNKEAIYKNFETYDNNSHKHLKPSSEYLHQHTSFLQGLTGYCYAATIPVTNVEFRFSHCAERLDQLITVYTTIKKEIESYKDGKELTELYKHILNETTKNIDRCMPLYEKEPYKNDNQKIFFSFTWECIGHVLDARILHAKETYKNHKNIFIATGGWHCDNMNYYLRQLGYSIANEYKISDFQNHNDQEPAAISIKEAFTKFGITLPASTFPKSVMIKPTPNKAASEPKLLMQKQKIVKNQPAMRHITPVKKTTRKRI